MPDAIDLIFPKNFSDPSQASTSFLTSQLAESSAPTPDEGPPRKKNKAEDDVKRAEQIIHVKKRMVSEINGLLELTETTKKVDPGDVKVSHSSASDRLVVSVVCILCKQEVKLGATKYTATLQNFMATST